MLIRLSCFYYYKPILFARLFYSLSIQWGCQFQAYRRYLKPTCFPQQYSLLYTNLLKPLLIVILLFPFQFICICMGVCLYLLLLLFLLLLLCLAFCYLWIVTLAGHACISAYSIPCKLQPLCRWTFKVFLGLT